MAFLAKLSTHLGSFALVTLLSSAASAGEPAPTPPPADGGEGCGATLATSFGCKGGLVLAGTAGFSMTNSTSTPEQTTAGSTEQKVSTTTIGLSPTVDYFVIPNVSVGLALGYQTSKATPDGRDASTTTTLGAGLRVGYSLPIGERFGLWPVVGFGYRSISFEPPSPAKKDETSALGLRVDLNFLVHLAKHYFMTVAPNLDMTLGGETKVDGTKVSKDSQMQFGLGLGFGGYINL